MKVLNSETAFRDHYGKKASKVFSAGTALFGGSAVAGSVAGGSALVAGQAAAAASAWSLGANLPLIGAFCAGKAAAVGAAATTAALTSAAVLLPAAALGLGAAGAIYYFCGHDKKPLHKGSSVSELAHAFARVACLPMLACAVSFCQSNPECEPAVREKICSEMGTWGYSEAYIREGIDEAMRHSPEELDGGYNWAIGQLEKGSTEGIGATPSELPAKAVRAFADEFKEKFQSCIG